MTLTPDWIDAVKFTTDGNQLLASIRSGLDIGAIAVWNSQTCECIRLITDRYEIKRLEMSDPLDPTSLLAVPGTGETRLVVRRTGAVIGWLPVPLWEVAAHPSGRAWAAGLGKYLGIFELEGVCRELNRKGAGVDSRLK